MTRRIQNEVLSPLLKINQIPDISLFLPSTNGFVIVAVFTVACTYVSLLLEIRPKLELPSDS